MRTNLAIVGFACLALPLAAHADGGNPVNQTALDDIQVVLNDLQKTTPDTKQALVHLATTEYEWMSFRIVHQDNPHTPITEDTFLGWTAAAIKDTTSATTDAPDAAKVTADINHAIADLTSAKNAANYGPPPYGNKTELDRFCRQVLGLDLNSQGRHHQAASSNPSAGQN